MQVSLITLIYNHYIFARQSNRRIDLNKSIIKSKFLSHGYTISRLSKHTKYQILVNFSPLIKYNPGTERFIESS